MSVALKKTIMKLIKIFSDKRNMWFIDTLLILMSYFLVEILVFSIRNIAEFAAEALVYTCISVVIHLTAFFSTSNYNVMWQHADYRDYFKMTVLCGLIGIIMISISAYFKVSFFYVKSAFLATVITSVALVGYRVMIKLLYSVMKQYFSLKKNGVSKNVLVIGAGSAGSIFLNFTKIDPESNYHVVGFVDDNPSKYMNSIGGVKVLGNRNDIPTLCHDLQVDEILIAIPTLDIKSRKDIVNICTKTGCHVKIMPTLEGFTNDNALPEIRNVNIEDLLARDTIILDDNGIEDSLNGKTVLVTGGGGSIGSELCRQLIKYNPGLLIILDIYENNAYDLQNELISDYPGQDIEVIIASVRDKKRLDDIFRRYRPDIVFHAAAHKHVPLMEFSPGEAVKNNVFGTYNVAKCADENNVGKFVMISTDKAVNPTNVMGATKRMCEMIVQAMNKISRTSFVAVRFGNVLGSNGSVIPLFKKQIAAGGPVTVTHKEITRFFMTIPEAAQLVLQASCFAKGGEIFILDMGEPVKIYDLAQNLIRLSGFVPDKDIKIEITGLRPGEKLYEELLMNEEGLKNTEHNKIYIGKPLEIDIEDIHNKLQKLSDAVESGDNGEIINCLSEVVPTYVCDTSYRNDEVCV